MSDTENHPQGPGPLTMYKKNWPYLLSGLVSFAFLRWQAAEHGRPVTLVGVLCTLASVPFLYWAIVGHVADPSRPREERGIWIFLTVCLALLCIWITSLLEGA